MHTPITTAADLDAFEKHGQYVKWEQRQPAAVSWWISSPDVGTPTHHFTELAEGQLLRMKTSPFSRQIPKALE